MPFDPQVNQGITIDGVAYRFREHPAAPGFPYGQEGRYGMVYQLQMTSAPRKRRELLAELCALKVFKVRYRVPAMAELAARIDDYASLPGLQVCRRTVLVPQVHGALLRQFPDLAYAVLMPWIEGPTWMQVMVEQRDLPADDGLALAQALAGILATLEQHGMAHCDISGPNVILPGLVKTAAAPTGPAVALVDVEQLYAPGLPAPDFLPSSSPGYSHLSSRGGLWNATADRFAGAVVLAEMLGACDPQVRGYAYGESYFEPGETQQPSARYDLLYHVLCERWGSRVGELFKCAWESQTLADCPTFAEWAKALKMGEEAPLPLKGELWVCPNGACGKANPPQTRRCAACDTLLAQECPECGLVTSLLSTGICALCHYSYTAAKRRAQIRAETQVRKDEMVFLERIIKNIQTRGSHLRIIEWPFSACVLASLIAVFFFDGAARVIGEQGLLIALTVLTSYVFTYYRPRKAWIQSEQVDVHNRLLHQKFEWDTLQREFASLVPEGGHP